MSDIVFLNNKYFKFKEAKISIEDRGFQFSDSVYEVVAVLNKKILDFDFHIRRLKYSTSELKFNYKVNNNFIKNIFQTLIKRNKLNNGIIYLQITRGVQSREHVYTKKLIPNVIIYTAKKKFNLPNKNYKGVKAITYPDIRWGRPDIKTTSLLANIIAATEASKKFAYEAILVKGKKITEAAHSNVWIVKDNNIITHPANKEILKGVTRTVLINIIKSLRFKLIEKEFSIKALFKADEVFITSSASFVTPVIQIDNVKINNKKIGKITKSLALNLYKSIN
ncbi:aminotransferase class IV [Pelagibacterales bacterium SAG-MED31]|nr:aminotransferase class IV [Pelagibacterales bacterium SAG-MED31]